MIAFYSKRSLFGILALGLLVWVSAWFAIDTGSFEKIAPKPNDVRAYIENAHIKQYNDQGDLQYESRIAHIFKYFDNASDLQTIKGSLISENAKPNWFIQAPKGRLNSSGDLLHLQGGILMYQPASANQAQTNISMDSLDIFPKNDKATSDDLITISQENTLNKTTGHGLEVDNKQKTILLKKDVKSTYESDIFAF